MNKIDLSFLRFDLFDGEGGGDGSAATSSTTGGFDYGDDARAFLKSMGIEESTPEVTGEQIVYGKAQPEVTEVSASPVGKDTSEPEVDLASEFKELIGKNGKFHDVYGEAVSQAIDKRFKNQADLKSTLSQYDDAISPLMQKYGLETGDIAGLVSAMAADEDIYSSEAEKNGMTVEQYRNNLKLQAEAKRGREIQEAYENEKARTALYAEWDRQADELRIAFPAFDLGQEIQNNEKFAHLIDNGVSVQDAFLVAHAQDILSGMNANARQQGSQDVITNIQQRASRPAENGMKHNAAVVRKADPNTFTDEDMDRILKQVAEGKPFVL